MISGENWVNTMTTDALALSLFQCQQMIENACNLSYYLKYILQINYYCQTSKISHTLVGNKVVDHSNVVGASPVTAAPITSLFSTQHLPSIDWAKTTARLDEKHLNLGIWCIWYRRAHYSTEQVHSDRPAWGQSSKLLPCTYSQLWLSVFSYINPCVITKSLVL